MSVSTRKILFFLSLSVFLLAACDMGELAETSSAPGAYTVLGNDPASAPLQTGSDGISIPDRYIVVFQNIPGHEVSSKVTSLSQGVPGMDVHFVYTSAIRGFAATIPAQAVAALENNPNVDYIEPDRTWSLDNVQTNAPWHLDRIDQRLLPLDNNYNYLLSGSGVHVYIIDTGINPHAQFGSRLRPDLGMTAINDGNGTSDCSGHGTPVASSAAGATLGTAKEAFLIPIRVGDCYGGLTTSWVVAGLDWVSANHITPAVANLSISSTNPNFWQRTFTRTITSASKGLVASGVSLVTSAGNHPTSPDDACNYTPNHLEQVVTVGASTPNDSRAHFSFYGPCIDLFAPGTNVTVASHTSFTGTTITNGTSFSAPLVAGVIALMLQENPNMTPDQILSTITSNSTTNVLSDIGPGSPNRLLYSIDIGVNISGPQYINESNTHSWTAVPSGMTSAPDGFQWQKSTSSSTGPWTDVGTSSTLQLNVNLGDDHFWLRATISRQGYTASKTKYVHVDPGDGCVGFLC